MICTCAMHCTRSGYHERACCDGPLCDCWCHRRHERRVNAPERLAKAAYIRYARHQNRCDVCRSGKDCGQGVILAVRWQSAAKAAGQIRETAA